MCKCFGHFVVISWGYIIIYFVSDYFIFCLRKGGEGQREKGEGR